MRKKLLQAWIYSLFFISTALCSETENLLVFDKYKSLNIEKNSITISGISSGAYMATQMHISYSALISGAAMIAGGPYYCAHNSLATALGSCMKTGASDIDSIINTINEYERVNLIDPVNNLMNDPVWIFHGHKDVIMSEKNSTDIAKIYSHFRNNEISQVYNIEANHGMPTIKTGGTCDSIGPPFLNSCNYDAAGQLLQSMYDNINNKTNADRDNLFLLEQNKYTNASFSEYGFVYIPKQCQKSMPCKLHVVLHGCRQSAEFVQTEFVEGAGYNEWGEANNIIMIYPQISSGATNPNGCWDWWGYTNSDYANRQGPQIQALFQIIKRMSGDVK